MTPVYTNGDYVVTVKYVKNIFEPKPNQDAIFFSKKYGVLIKRIKSVDYLRKTVIIKGINNYSVTSENVGEIPFEQLISKVVLRIRNYKTNIDKEN